MRTCGYWSHWHLLSISANTGARRYGEFIYDSCNNDKQLFPVARDPRTSSCNNDDNLYPSAKFSLCPTLPRRTVPAGLPFDAECMALAETAIGLHAVLQPDTYDARQPATLQLTTSFSTDFSQLLSDATCSDVLGWTVTAWEVLWPDGAFDTQPGTAQQGITATHTLPGDPSAPPSPRPAAVVVRAHLHITAQGVDFDDSAQPFVRRLTADVVVSNDAGAAGSGGAPAYAPPLLAVGAVPVGQLGDGRVPVLDTALLAQRHAVTIRGRLLELYPRAIVLRPGTESVGGVVVGEGRSTLVRWAYLGPATDAPAGEGSLPGDSGAPLDSVAVQWNHAERLDTNSNPVDETVPMRLTVRTAYPDGHVETGDVVGAVSVSIYYVGLNLGNG